MEPDDLQDWNPLPEFCEDYFVDSMTRTPTSPQQNDNGIGHALLQDQRGADALSEDEGAEEYQGRRPCVDEDIAGKDEGVSGFVCLTKPCTTEDLDVALLGDGVIHHAQEGAAPGTTQIGSLGFVPLPGPPAKDSMLGKRKRLGYRQGEDGAWECEGLSPEDIIYIMFEHKQGTSASSFPEIPVFRTWPSKQCTTRANAQSLQSHGNTPECNMISVEEIERGIFWPTWWIRDSADPRGDKQARKGQNFYKCTSKGPEAVGIHNRKTTQYGTVSKAKVTWSKQDRDYMRCDMIEYKVCNENFEFSLIQMKKLDKFEWPAKAEEGRHDVDKKHSPFRLYIWVCYADKVSWSIYQ